MPSSTLGDVPVTGAWTDIVATRASAASVPVLVQNVGAGPIFLAWGGGSAPGVTVSGVLLNPTDSMSGTAANIWVKSGAVQGAVAVTVL